LSGGDQRWVKRRTRKKRSVAGDKMIMMMMTAVMISIIIQNFRGKAERKETAWKTLQ
jgi:hypothetical protein